MKFFKSIKNVKSILFAFSTLYLVSCGTTPNNQDIATAMINVDSIVNEKLRIEKEKADSISLAKIREEEILKNKEIIDKKNNCDNAFKSLKSNLEGLRDIGNNPKYNVYEDHIVTFESELYMNQISRIELVVNMGIISLKIYDNNSNQSLSINMDATSENSRQTEYRIAKNLIKYLYLKLDKDIDIQFYDYRSGQDQNSEKSLELRKKLEVEYNRISI